MTNPRILRAAAARALADAREAWKKARASPDDRTVRNAMRACLLAGRMLRRAANVVPGESPAMLQEAERLDAAAAKLRTELVTILETRRTVL